MPICLVTGSSGLIGSEVCEYLRHARLRGPRRRQQPARGVFRPAGRYALEPAAARARRSQAFTITSSTSATGRGDRRPGRGRCARRSIVHAAAQPSHDRAAAIPFDDFDTNAVGTLNLLEAARAVVPGIAVRAHVDQQGLRRPAQHASRSTSVATRWDYADPAFAHGIPETFSIDQSKHSLFGASKVAADVHGAGVRPLLRDADVLPARRLPHRAEPHRRRAARLPQLSGEVQPRRARVQGVRLQGQTGPRQHPLRATSPRFIHAFCETPRVGEVYNIGGGKANSCSILEAFDAGRGGHRDAAADHTYVDENARRRPHLLLQRSAQDEGALPRLGHHRRRSSRRCAKSSTPGTHACSAR